MWNPYWKNTQFPTICKGKHYLILSEAPTRKFFQKKSLEKMEKQKEKQDGIDLRKRQSEKQIQPVIPYLLSQGIEGPITVEKMKNFLKAKQQAMKEKSLPKFRIVLGNNRGETIKSIQSWMQYEQQASITQVIEDKTREVSQIVAEEQLSAKSDGDTHQQGDTLEILVNGVIETIDARRNPEISTRTIPNRIENAQKRRRKANQQFQDFVQ